MTRAFSELGKKKFIKGEKSVIAQSDTTTVIEIGEK